MKFFTAICFLFFSLAATCYCGDSDLDDGIPLDDSIRNYDELKKPLNKSYIKRKAKSTADFSKANGYDITEDSVIGIGNVVIQPGSEVDDIVIIIEGLDDITVVGEKK